MPYIGGCLGLQASMLEIISAQFMHGAGKYFPQFTIRLGYRLD
jgi:hypothetical protein